MMHNQDNQVSNKPSFKYQDNTDMKSGIGINRGTK